MFSCRLVHVSFFLTSLFLLSSAQSLSKEECDSRMKAMDTNIAKALLVYNNQMKPFTSVKEARETYCDPMLTSWLKTVSNFKPCLKNFQRTVFGIMVVNMKKVAKTTCNSDVDLQKAVTHSKCFTPNNVVALYEIANKFTIVVEHAYTRNSTSRMLNALCCGYHETVNRFSSEMNELCKNQSVGAGTFIESLVRGVTSESIDMMCSQYPNVDACAQKSPQVLKNVRKALSLNSPLYSYTPFTSFVKIIAKLDEDLNIE